MWTIRRRPVNFAKIKKILVVHLRPLGDVLLTSGYLGALRRKFPDARIDYLVFKPYDRLLYKNPYLSNIIAVEKGKGKKYLFNRLKMFYRVNRGRYDLIIDSNNTTTSAQILALSGARYRLGNEQGKGRLFYNLLAADGPERYNAAKRFDTLKPLGIDEEAFELYFCISPEAQAYIDEWIRAQGLQGKPIALFSPGSGYPQKAWSGAGFARVADEIRRRTDLVPVILWGPGEEPYVEEMCAAMTTEAYVLPPTTIDQCAAVLKRASFLFCNDGGVNHLAVATQTPTLAFFGIIYPQSWSPHGYVPTHFHMYNPQFDWRTNFTRDYGYTAEEAFAKFKQIAPQFNIKVYE
jgi:ADP-heptose:LPS heptosyltransferase